MTGWDGSGHALRQRILDRRGAMHRFHVKGGSLWAEGVSVERLAKAQGTPLYIYSRGTLADHYRRLDAALVAVPHMVCYAVKANSNLSVLSALAREGSGFDIVSGGELYRVLKAGGDASRCTFAGVGKTREEIEFALRKGIGCFVAESEAELVELDRVARRMKRRAPVAVRVNPDVAAGGHAKITTGTYESKFGVAYESVPALYEKASRMRGLSIRGVQMHIGSQITAPGPFIEAMRKMAPLVRDLKAAHGIEFFSVGGGVGIVYDPALASGASEWWDNRDVPLTIDDYASAVVAETGGLGLQIQVEPGRLIVGNAGVFVARVLYVKQTGTKRFVIVDAAMNDLIRPALYGSFHEIVPVRQLRSAVSDPEFVPTDVVGPICESGDAFCHDRLVPDLRAGDLVAFLSTGAYGFAMASNYNARPRPAEVMVDGRKARVVRRRETLADLVRGESR